MCKRRRRHCDTRGKLPPSGKPKPQPDFYNQRGLCASCRSPDGVQPANLASVKSQTAKKSSEPARAQAAPKLTPPDREIDLAGSTYRINLLLPRTETVPGSRFFPAFQPLPSGTLVAPEFAAKIEEHRADPGHEDEGEPTLTFQPGVSYSIDPQGRRLSPRAEQQAVAMMRAQQADEALREEEREAREAVEKEEWFQQKLRDEFESTQAKMRCLEEIDRRRLEAEDFLERERQEQEAREREDAVPTISKGPL
jgi:hypothetical protein